MALIIFQKGVGFQENISWHIPKVFRNGKVLWKYTEEISVSEGDGLETRGYHAPVDLESTLGLAVNGVERNHSGEDGYCYRMPKLEKGLNIFLA